MKAWLIRSLVLLCTALPLTAQDHGRETPQPAAPYLGIFPTKAPGTTGSWSVEDAFPDLTFTDPLQLVELPGEGLWAMAGKAGQVWIFDDDPATTTKTTALDISPQVLQQPDGGLLGMILHPEFNVPASPNRRYLYLFYRYTPEPLHTGRNAYIRLSRFTLNEALDFIDPASEYVLIQQYDRHDWHNGGGIFFDDEGYLYAAIGDEGGANDQYGVAQKIDQGFFSGLLRIDIEQDPTRSHPIRRQPQDGAAPPSGWPSSFSQGYYVPNDNPWLDPGGTVLEEFFAIGLRSPHRVTFDPVEEEIWVGDVGQGAREEISIIPKGSNLQWPYKEGFLDGQHAQPDPLIGFEQVPLWDYPRSFGTCIIGGFVYRGGAYAGALDGKYIFGDHTVRNIWALTPDPGGGAPSIEFLVNVPPGGSGSKNGISSFSINSGGDIYVLKLNGTDQDGGKIYRLVQNDVTPDPPMWLSQLGLFADLSTLTPAATLLPYDVNAPLWSDRAAKGRWVALPNDGSHDTDSEKVLIRPYGDWEFPQGTVFVKHFELPQDLRDPALVNRLETRLLVLDENGGSYGLTYRWNLAQTDAQLLSTSESAFYDIILEDGSMAQQEWTFPSRSDCTTCHNANAGWVRGVNTQQLNGAFQYPGSGVTDNQLRTWNHLGMLRPPLREADIAALPMAVAVDHASYDMAHRTRSYLDANCAQCHRPNGVNAMFDARFTTPLSLQNLIDGPLVGDYGDPAARVIAPQDPARSILLQRVSSEAVDRMPPLASVVAHGIAIDTIDRWVDEVDGAGTLCDNLELAIPQSELTLLYSDSEEGGTPASHAFDNDPETFWHSEWQASDPPHPHELQFDMGASYTFSGLTYLPRQTASPNGTVADFTVYVSEDPGNWGTAIASGSFPADQLESRFAFSATGRYVRFVADSEINGNPWTTIAELNFLKAPCQAGCAPAGAIGELSVTQPPGGTSLSWTSTGGSGIVYDTLRLDAANELAVVQCVESRDVDTTALDDTMPVSGAAFFYLIREVDCTGAVASAGTDSAGAPRNAALCD